MSMLELQKSVFARLSTLSYQIYDAVPQSTAGDSNAAFPYIVVGDDTFDEWDTDEDLGYQATVTIHCWSRYTGKKEVKEMQDAIYSTLHRYPLVVSGYNVVDVIFEFAETMLDPDGKTRHGVQRARIILEGV